MEITEVTVEVMIDLESLAVTESAKLLSIGACWFNPFRLTSIEELRHDAFYQNIDPESYEGHPEFVEDLNTVKWWRDQSVTAREALKQDQVDWEEAIRRFSKWITTQKFKSVWANPPNFDINMLQFHYRHHINRRCPWKHYEVTDYRTMKRIAHHWCDWKKGEFQAEIENQVDPAHELVAHNALDDAIKQARLTQLVYQILAE